MFKVEFDEPLDIAELASGEICTWEVRFLVKHLLVLSYLNGRLDERELMFVARLAEEMGMNEEEYRQLKRRPALKSNRGRCVSVPMKKPYGSRSENDDSR